VTVLPRLQVNGFLFFFSFEKIMKGLGVIKTNTAITKQW